MDKHPRVTRQSKQIQGKAVRRRPPERKRSAANAAWQCGLTLMMAFEVLHIAWYIARDSQSIALDKLDNIDFFEIGSKSKTSCR